MKIIDSKETKNIYISLNYHCNNKCIMCGVPFKKHNAYNEPLEFYIQELKKIPFPITEKDIITISGGEPFLFSSIFDFIEYIRYNYKCKITIFTNGRMLKNKDYVKKLQKYKIDRLIIPFFSYDEATYDLIAGAKGAYQEWKLALCNLEKESLYYELKFLPMKQNYLHILDSYIFSKKVFPKSKFTICGVQYFGQAVINVGMMGIKYSDLVESIELTLEYALKSFGEFIPVYRFPMCLLDAKYNNHGIITLSKEYLIGPDYSDIYTNGNKGKKIKIPSACEACASFCDWYSVKYESIYGLNELNPITTV